MNDKRIFDSWSKIEPDSSADARMLDAILTRKHELYEKQERREKLMICLIQIALFVLTFSLATVFVVNQGTVILFFIMGYVLIGGFVSVIVALASNNNIVITGRVNSYD